MSPLPPHLSALPDPVSDPYATSQELLVDQLLAIRLRLGEAVTQLDAWSRGELACWSRELLDLEAAIDRRARASTALAMTQLCERFELAPSERRLLWTLVAHAVCPVSRTLLHQLSTERDPELTSDVLGRVVHGLLGTPEVMVELGPDATLVRYGLIEACERERAGSEHRTPWRLSRRVLSLVQGEIRLDPSLGRLATLETSIPALEDLVLDECAVTQLDEVIRRDAFVIVHGRLGAGRRSALLAIAGGLGHRILRVDARELARDRDRARHQLRQIARECRLLGLVPLIRDLDALTAGETVERIDLVEDELPGLVLATSRDPIARQRWTRAPISVELPPLPLAGIRTLWGRALPAARSGDLEVLSTLYPMTPALIHSVGRLAVERCGTAAMKPAHIEDAMRSVLDDRLAGLARRVEVKQSWDDLVLADEQRTAIRDLIARIAYRPEVYEKWGFDRLGRGLGISALFSGPPGTGKTMAAGLLAASVHLPLYQVDLSKIVSKWIGETEKNLAALFDAAEAGHAILLFDEADALFGKRTEVKSSNDRHANQETNFLLQRLETYGGICVLTTNHENAIDEAFRRRITTHLRFPMPDEDERAQIWRALLPPEAPVDDDLDVEALAHTYVMSGGYIRNAVLRAAFLAAAEKGPIDRQRLSRAAQLEYERLGKVFIAKH
jgi:ATP-dependent 26S proteasome regulatory subunit